MTPEVPLEDLDPEDMIGGAREIITLIRERFPAGFWAGEPADRALLSAALLRLADTADATVQLHGTGLDLDAMTLVRSLLEQTITFAWMAADTDDRVPRWLDQARVGQRKLHNDLLKFGQTFLTPDQLADVEGAREMVDLASRASQADEYWASRLPGLHAGSEIGSLRGLYATFYRGGSRSVHGDALALDGYMTQGVRPALTVHQRLSDDRRFAYALVAPLLAIAAIIATAFMPMLSERRIRAAAARANGQTPRL